MNDDLRKLIADWHRRCRQSQRVQYECAVYYARLHTILGVFTATLTTIVGTAIFYDLVEDTSFRIVTGLISLSASVLASLQTFLRFGKRSDLHREHSARYASLRRSLEQIMAAPPQGQQLQRVLDSVRTGMNQLAKTSQTIPRWAKGKAVQDLSREPRKNPHFGKYDLPQQLEE